MAFFKSPKNKLPQLLQNIQKTDFYDTTDYYIGTKNKIDTLTSEVIQSSASGPSDYNSYYNINAAKLFISYSPKTKYNGDNYYVVFPAIIDSYSETFNATFNQEQLYGRMDAVQKYLNTSRTINVSFKILAYDEYHSSKNLDALSTLAQFLYPVYSYNQDKNDSLSNATAISESPLWRVKFANLIQSTKINKNIDKDEFYNFGLLVAPTEFNFQPNLEAGFFVMDNTYLFPKEIKLSLTFNVVHENTLGWFTSNKVKFDWIGNMKEESENKDKRTKVFPWGDTTLEGNETSSTSTINANEAKTNAKP